MATARISHATAGSRPGENWADAIFSFIYFRILASVATEGQGEGFLDIPFLGEEIASAVPCSDATRADNSAFATSATLSKVKLRTWPALSFLRARNMA